MFISNNLILYINNNSFYIHSIILNIKNNKKPKKYIKAY